MRRRVKKYGCLDILKVIYIYIYIYIMYNGYFNFSISSLG